MTLASNARRDSVRIVGNSEVGRNTIRRWLLGRVVTLPDEWLIDTQNLESDGSRPANDPLLEFVKGVCPDSGVATLELLTLDPRGFGRTDSTPSLPSNVKNGFWKA